jgi:hypothetical protein
LYGSTWLLLDNFPIRYNLENTIQNIEGR